MDIFEQFISSFVSGALGLSGAGADSASFFIYDTIKVFLLLVVMVFLVSILRTFITRGKIRKILGKKAEGWGNLLAALLGVPTPFCSCSAVPIFIGFLEAGVPLGITFSFLISSPMVNEIAIALLLGLVGWQITAIYIVSGLVVATFAGIIIGRMGMEGEVRKFGKENAWGGWKGAKIRSWADRIEFAKLQTRDIVSGIWQYIILAIGLGALIHGYVPMDFFASFAGPQNPFAVFVAVLAGVPIYSNAAGTIPIIEALMSKGMAVGTALAFMMSITALSLPEMIILKRVLKPKLLAAFVLVISAGILLIGLLFNAIL
ncbi:MAG: permease [Candidatus Micrarchaeota archaeon]